MTFGRSQVGERIRGRSVRRWGLRGARILEICTYSECKALEGVLTVDLGCLKVSRFASFQNQNPFTEPVEDDGHPNCERS